MGVARPPPAFGIYKSTTLGPNNVAARKLAFQVRFIIRMHYSSSRARRRRRLNASNTLRRRRWRCEEGEGRNFRHARSPRPPPIVPFHFRVRGILPLEFTFARSRPKMTPLSFDGAPARRDTTSFLLESLFASIIGPSFTHSFLPSLLLGGPKRHFNFVPFYAGFILAFPREGLLARGGPQSPPPPPPPLPPRPLRSL